MGDRRTREREFLGHGPSFAGCHSTVCQMEVILIYARPSSVALPRKCDQNWGRWGISNQPYAEPAGYRCYERRVVEFRNLPQILSGFGIDVIDPDGAEGAEGADGALIILQYAIQNK